MKSDKARFWAAACTAALLTFGVVGVLATAFELTVSTLLPLYLAAVCLLAAMAASFRWGWILVPAGCLWLSLELLSSGRLSVSVEATLFYITDFFHTAYSCGRIRWSGDDLQDGNITVVLIMLGLCVAFLTAWSVYRRKRLAVPIVTGLIPLGLCAAVPEVQPSDLYLLPLISGVILLLLCTGIRNPRDRDPGALMAMAAAPVVLTVLLVLLSTPHSVSVSTGTFPGAPVWVSHLLAGITGNSPVQSNGPTLSGGGVDLSQAGPRTNSNSRVMEVTTSYRGALYLRSSAYDTYSGTDWAVSKNDWARDTDYFAGRGAVSVSIRTYSSYGYLFLPCYPLPDNSLQINRGQALNTMSNKFSYALNCSPGTRTVAFNRNKATINGSSVITIAPEDNQILNSGEMNQYLQLPDETYRAARRILQQVDAPGRNLLLGEAAQAEYMYLYAKAIESYVKNTADYDLKTDRMPSDETDFAIWFLTNSDTGYCTHFASAAVVLLRAAGIPARYVVGYTMNTSESQYVLLRDAHAWVEYWLPGLGWMMLEPTPGIGSNSTTGNSSQTPVSSSGPSSSPSGEDSSSSSSAGSSSRPSGDSSSSDSSRPDNSSTVSPEPNDPGTVIPWRTIGTVLLRICGVLLGIAAFLLQWKLRVRLHRWCLHRGAPNRQALTRWKFCCYWGFLLRETPPEALRRLAEKACFSAHTLTPAELAAFDRYLDHCRTRMQRRSFLHQLLYRPVLALY